MNKNIIEEIKKNTPADKWVDVPGTRFKKVEVFMNGEYIQVFVTK